MAADTEILNPLQQRLHCRPEVPAHPVPHRRDAADAFLQDLPGLIVAAKANQRLPEDVVGRQVVGSFSLANRR